MRINTRCRYYNDGKAGCTRRTCPFLHVDEQPSSHYAPATPAFHVHGIPITVEEYMEPATYSYCASCEWQPLGGMPHGATK